MEEKIWNPHRLTEEENESSFERLKKAMKIYIQKKKNIKKRIRRKKKKKIYIIAAGSGSRK